MKMGHGASFVSVVPSRLFFSCVPKIQSEKEKITNRRRRLWLLDILFAVPSSLKTIVDSWLQRWELPPLKFVVTHPFLFFCFYLCFAFDAFPFECHVSGFKIAMLKVVCLLFFLINISHP